MSRALLIIGGRRIASNLKEHDNKAHAFCRVGRHLSDYAYKLDNANFLTIKTMIQLGFKTISLGNWMTPDPLMDQFVMSADEWVVAILDPKLEETVPIEIIKLFEVARGSMLYGYFFYPLFTLAYEQLLRVVEAAISEKCKQTGASKSVDSFNKKVAHLQEVNVLSEKENMHCDTLRYLRNIASHPAQQTILTPGNTLGFVTDISRLINRLFRVEYTKPGEVL